MIELIIGSITIISLIGLAILFLIMPKPKAPSDPVADIHAQMTPQLQTELENNLKASFQAQIDEASGKFAAALGGSSKSISDQLGSVSTKLVDEEVAKFQQALGELRTNSAELAKQLDQASQSSIDAASKVSDETMAGVRQAIAATLKDLQAESTGALAKISEDAKATSQQLHANLQSEIQAERKLLAGRFDDKMADIISAYLAQALGGGIDLGAQRDYVMQTLESRRDDIKRDLLGEI